MKRKFAWLLALMLLVMIPFSQCQAVSIAGYANKIRKKDFGSPKLKFAEGARGQWQKVSGNKMQARFSVYNPAESDKTVKAFELYVYAKDVWGNRIYGDTTYYYWTTKKNVAPGKSVYSDYCTIPDRSEVETLHVAIKKFIYTDGTIVEIKDDDLDYWKWTINWK